MRLSIKDAESLGILSKSKAKTLRHEMSKQTSAINHRLAVAANIKPEQGAPSPSLSYLANPDTDPQRKIFDELMRLKPGIAMWEVEGLVSGRNFRCDIYLPESRVVIEMDGYGPHRSKEQFQSDRDKRNLLASTGYIVLAFYYAQVKHDFANVIAQIMQTHNFYKPFMEQLFHAHLVIAQRAIQTQ